MQTTKLTCGCEFELNKNNEPIVSYDLNKVNLQCQLVWNLISSGKTIGLFQIDSGLGQQLSKRLKPQNINHLAALIAIMRPSCLQAKMEDGRSITDHLIDRKNGIEEIKYQHPVLKSILDKTYGVLCIHEDTYISMGDGTEIAIKNILPKDKTISINQKNLKCELDECYDIKISPKTEGYEVILKNGQSIILTKDHKVLTQNGEKEVQCLDIDNDVIQYAFKQKKLFNIKSLIEQNKFSQIHNNQQYLSYLIGQIIGDGCYNHHLTIASGNDSNHQKLLNWLQQNFAQSLKFREYFHTRSNYISIIGKEFAKLDFPNHRKKIFTQFLEKFRLNKTKHAKIIHPDLLRLSKKNRRALLAGIFDADGHTSVSQNGYCICHYSTNNIQVLNSIRKFLSFEGIATWINKEKTHLHISNTKKFTKIISPYLVIKIFNGKLRCGKYFGQYPKNKIKQLYTISTAQFAKNQNIGESSFYNKNLFFSSYTAKKAGINFGDIRYLSIKSIKKIDKPLLFYSISIKNNHNLIGNGMVIKNCYQEQSIQIASEIAGLSLQDSDHYIRYGIGKKKADIIAEAKKIFLSGCKKVGKVNESESYEIWQWIESAARYQFNASHSYFYAMTTFLTAMAKAHFPLRFFQSYLNHAINKQNPADEIKSLINDARSFGIDIIKPDLRLKNQKFIIKDGRIHFGLGYIKGIGDKAFNELILALDYLK